MNGTAIGLQAVCNSGPYILPLLLEFKNLPANALFGTGLSRPMTCLLANGGGSFRILLR